MSILSEWIEKNRHDPDHELAVRNYDMNKDMYERELVSAIENEKVVVCQHCKYPQDTCRNHNAGGHVELQCCFHCWFWLHHIGVANPKPNAVIINGVHRMDGGVSRDRKEFLGFGGAEWYYRRLGETKIRMTNNMWHQGDIPKMFSVPDNCVMCTKDEYKAQQVLDGKDLV